MTTEPSGAPRCAKRSDHRTRFKRIRNLLSPTSRALRDAVVEQIVQPLEAAGFSWVGCNFGDPDLPASANEIILERRGADDRVDFIWVNFHKSLRPHFQLRLGQARGTEPRQSFFSASLVRRRTQYYHFWGVRWWWLDQRPERAVAVVATVADLLPQVLAMLDTEVEGPNVRRSPWPMLLPGSLG